MMLLDYYGLNETAIRRDALTLDTCFLAEVIAKRLAAIYYAIEERRGFSALVASPAWARQLFSSVARIASKNLQGQLFYFRRPGLKGFLDIWFGTWNCREIRRPSARTTR